MKENKNAKTDNKELTEEQANQVTGGGITQIGPNTFAGETTLKKLTLGTEKTEESADSSNPVLPAMGFGMTVNGKTKTGADDTEADEIREPQLARLYLG